MDTPKKTWDLPRLKPVDHSLAPDTEVIMRHSLEQHTDPPPCSPTRKQQEFLARNKLHPGPDLDFYEAMHVIGRFVSSRRRMPPTARQEKFLKEQGKWREGMSRGEAFDAIKQCFRDSDRGP
jgi:hypothetical protein